MSRRLPLHLAVLAAVALASVSARRDYSRADAEAALASASPLARCIARMESTNDPNAVGALGEQGLVQILPRGSAWWHFWEQGHSDPFDPYQAVAFLEHEIAAGRSGQWSTRGLC